MVILPSEREYIIETLIGVRQFKFASQEEAIRIFASFMNGSTQKTAARYAGIGVRTLRYWKKNDEDFDEACGDACSHANDLVGRSLFQAATIPDRGGKVNVSACIFWLKNRASEEWRDEYVVPAQTNEDAKPPTTPERVQQVIAILKEQGVIV